MSSNFHSHLPFQLSFFQVISSVYRFFLCMFNTIDFKNNHCSAILKAWIHNMCMFGWLYMKLFYVGCGFINVLSVLCIFHRNIMDDSDPWCKTNTSCSHCPSQLRQNCKPSSSLFSVNFCDKHLASMTMWHLNTFAIAVYKRCLGNLRFLYVFLYFMC